MFLFSFKQNALKSSLININSRCQDASIALSVWLSLTRDKRQKWLQIKSILILCTSLQSLTWHNQSFSCEMLFMFSKLVVTLLSLPRMCSMYIMYTWKLDLVFILFYEVLDNVKETTYLSLNTLSHITVKWLY